MDGCGTGQCMTVAVDPTLQPIRTGSFTRFAQTFARVAGRPTTVIIAVLLVLAWLCIGPLYHFSETWLLALNTATTVITFLMVFLIQHSQLRDTAAIQLKLSEILLAMEGAANRIAAIEHASDEELALLQQEYLERSASPDPPTGRRDPASRAQSKTGLRRR
jgi:low affinity Fe/Cu permease